MTFPTDAKLTDRARVRLVKLAKAHGVDLRQSYVRVGKLALIMHQRYAHAKHFGRAQAKLRRLRTYRGRTMRDIERAAARARAQARSPEKERSAAEIRIDLFTACARSGMHRQR